MDNQPTRQSRNSRKRRGSAPGHLSTGAKRSRRGGMSGIAAIAVALIVMVAFLGMRVGVGRWFRPSAPNSSTQNAASAASNAGAPGAVAKAAASRQGEAKPAPVSGTASSEASGGPAWATADPSWIDRYKGKIIDGFKTESGYKAVALTFDDGPNGETQHVIDTLAKYGGQATFFDSGRKLAMSWAVTQPSIIWKAGFELGNHTQHHTLPDGVSSMWHRSYATDLAEINGPDKYAVKGTGRKTVWLRPMGGMIDATGVKAAVNTGHLVINWTIDSNDSHGGPRTPDYIYDQVTNGIKSGDVVLLHVTHPESMAALPRIAATLNQRGFKLVTLSELAQHSTAAITQSIPK